MPILLIAGLALGGIVTGYLVSASASPVAGVVLPAVISALATAVAVLIRNPMDDHVQEILKISKKADPKVQAEFADLLSRRKLVPRVIGLVLITFFVAYAIGLYVGARVRISNLFGRVETAAPELVDVAKSSQTFQEAIYKIGYYRMLASQGLKPSDLKDILSKPSVTATESQQITGPMLVNPNAAPGSTPTSQSPKNDQFSWPPKNDQFVLPPPAIIAVPVAKERFLPPELHDETMFLDSLSFGTPG